MSLLESLNATGGFPDQDKANEKAPWEKGRKFKYMNQTKKFILGKYPKVFRNLSLSNIKSAPILISLPVLMKKVEEIYNELTQRLLRKKTRMVLDVSQATRELTERNMKSNPTYLIQSLINLVYSADKHGDHPEVAQYLKFLVMPVGDYDVLYYLYIRQNYKILTHNSFLNNRVTGKDPTKLDMDFTTAMEICDHAFYYNPAARNTLRKVIKSKVKPKQRIRYYDFLVASMNSGLVFEDLELLNRLIVLYRVKGPEDIADEFTITMDLRKKREERNKALGYTGGNTGRGGNGGQGDDDFDKNEQLDIDDDMDMGSEGERKSLGGMFGDSDDEDDQEEGLKQGGNVLGEFDDDEDEDEDEDEEEEETSFYLEDENMLKKYKDKIKLEDNDLQKEIRRMSTRIIQEYITRFLDNNKSAKAGPAKKQQIFDKLYKKIYNLNTVIFYTDKPTYLDLLRVGKKNKDAENLWIEMNKQYLYMCDLDDTDAELITEFLNTWLTNELVQTNTDFFLEYEYQVTNPIIEEALKVDGEIIITTRRKK